MFVGRASRFRGIQPSVGAFGRGCLSRTELSVALVAQPFGLCHRLSLDPLSRKAKFFVAVSVAFRIRNTPQRRQQCVYCLHVLPGNLVASLVCNKPGKRISVVMRCGNGCGNQYLSERRQYEQSRGISFQSFVKPLCFGQISLPFGINKL